MRAGRGPRLSPMSLPKPTADNYERLFPETGVSDAEKQERMEQRVFRAERQEGIRTGRNRGIVVPELPWHRNREEDAA